MLRVKRGESESRMPVQTLPWVRTSNYAAELLKRASWGIHGCAGTLASDVRLRPCRKRLWSSFRQKGEAGMRKMNWIQENVISKRRTDVNYAS